MSNENLEFGIWNLEFGIWNLRIGIYELEFTLVYTLQVC